MLEARVAPAAAVLPVARRPDPVWTPPVLVKIASLQAGGPLPSGYEAKMVELAAARSEGLTWRAAFEKCELESRDLIGRLPHLHHGKIVQVVVTEAGRQLLEQAHGLVGEVEAKITHNLSAAEKQQVTSVLLRCCTALET